MKGLGSGRQGSKGEAEASGQTYIKALFLNDREVKKRRLEKGEGVSGKRDRG
jgi:hypothetical protein